MGQITRVIGLLIAAALSGVLLVSVALALRRGEIGRYRRGEPGYWAFVGLGGLGGLLILASAVHAYATHDDQPQTLEGEGFRVVVPASWEPLDAPDEGLPPSALAVAGGDSELIVLVSPATQAAARDLAEALRDPDVVYDKWEVREEGTALLVDTAYASPRGQVRARHLIADARAWTAVCSSRSDVEACDTIVASFSLKR